MLSMKEKMHALNKWAVEYDSKLTAYDTRFNLASLIVDDEGGVHFYKKSFIVEKEEFLVVFSEHHPFNIFCIDEVLNYEQFKQVNIPKFKK